VNQLGSDEEIDEEVARENSTPEPQQKRKTPEPQQKRKKVQGKRVRPVITAVPVIRSSSRVPTSDDESDADDHSANGSIAHSVENVDPSPVDVISVPSPTSSISALTRSPSEPRENQLNQDQPRKKRKLGPGLSRRPSNPPLQSRHNN
jgi:hypothetical protein